MNLEDDPTVVVTTIEWQLRGNGRILPLEAAPPDLRLVHSPEATGCVLIEVQPLQMHINQHNGWGFSETIDCDITNSGPTTM